MKIKYILLLLSLINLMTVSCQSKSEKINLKILDDQSQNIINNKQTYPLKYNDFIDSVHSRVVLKNNEIKEIWQPLSTNLKINYMDVYFNEEKPIGFKGLMEGKSINEAEDFYKNILKNISSDKTFKQIDLINNDTNIISSEWESSNLIVGINYEKPNKSVALIAINKNEISSFYDKIFYSEFLNLTKHRNKNSQIKFKELKVSPSKNDKNFYKEKFNELKNEYNKK